MRKSLHVSIPFLAAVAAGCGNHPVNVHLNPAGQCVNEFGRPVDPQACIHGGGYYGGTRYVYTGSGFGASTPAASETVRGTLGGSAEAHASGGDAAGGHGGGAGE